MRARKLIKELQALVNAHGDLEVWVDDSHLSHVTHAFLCGAYTYDGARKDRADKYGFVLLSKEINVSDEGEDLALHWDCP